MRRPRAPEPPCLESGVASTGDGAAGVLGWLQGHFPMLVCMWVISLYICFQKQKEDLTQESNGSVGLVACFDIVVCTEDAIFRHKVCLIQHISALLWRRARHATPSWRRRSGPRVRAPPGIHCVDHTSARLCTRMAGGAVWQRCWAAGHATATCGVCRSIAMIMSGLVIRASAPQFDRQSARRGQPILSRTRPYRGGRPVTALRITHDQS